MQYLKDSQRIEDHSGGPNGFASTPSFGGGGDVDFQTLVNRGVSRAQTSAGADKSNGKTPEDDIWGNILSPTPVQSPTPTHNQAMQRPISTSVSTLQSYSLPSSPAPFATSSANILAVASTRNPIGKGSSTNNSFSYPQPPQMSTPNYTSPLAPTQPLQPQRTNQPNNNINSLLLLPSQPLGPMIVPQWQSQTSQTLNYNSPLIPTNVAPSSPAVPFSSILSPSAPPNPSRANTQTQNRGKDAWGDFDPLA